MKIKTALVIDKNGRVIDLNQDNVWNWTGINGPSWGGGDNSDTSEWRKR